MEYGDADFGSGGTMLLPDSASPSATRSTVLTGGKTGIFYLLDTTIGLGTSSERQSFQATYDHWNLGLHAYCYATGWNLGPHIHAQPSFWPGAPGATAGHVFVWAERDYLRDYPYNYATRTFETQPAKIPAHGTIASPPRAMPGGSTVVSWDGANASSAIVWASIKESEDLCRCPGSIPYASMGQTWCEPAIPPYQATDADTGYCFTPSYEAPGRLYAFAATNLTTPLWSDSIRRASRFVPPTVADGRAIMATFDNRFNVYASGAKRLGRGTTQVTVVPVTNGALTQLHAFAIDPATNQLYTTWWTNKRDEVSWFPASRTQPAGGPWNLEAGTGADAWHLWYPVPGTANANPNQQVGAVFSGSGATARMDVFYVTASGRVYTAFWDMRQNHGAWQIAQLQPPGTVGADSAGVTALNQGNYYVSIFYVTAAGGVATMHFDVSSASNLWSPVGPITGAMGLPTNTPLSAVSRTADGSAADLVYVASNGQVWAAFCSSYYSWTAASVHSTGFTGSTTSRTPVALVRATDGRTDMFAVDGVGAGNLRWATITSPSGPVVYSSWGLGAGGTFGTSYAITAVSGASGAMELYGATPDGTVWTNTWPGPNPMSPIWTGWNAISAISTLRPNTRLNAVASNGGAGSVGAVLGTAASSGGPTGSNVFAALYALPGTSTASGQWQPWYNDWYATAPPHPTLP